MTQNMQDKNGVKEEMTIEVKMAEVQYDELYLHEELATGLYGGKKYRIERGIVNGTTIVEFEGRKFAVSLKVLAAAMLAAMDGKAAKGGHGYCRKHEKLLGKFEGVRDEGMCCRCNPIVKGDNDLCDDSGRDGRDQAGGNPHTAI